MRFQVPMFGSLVLFTLACAGLGEPADGDPAQALPEGWAERLAERAIEWEVMPGTTGDEDPARVGQLRAFFEAHPEYLDEEKQTALADLACAVGVEDAHERLQQPQVREPLVVEVTDAGWRVIVAHADRWCTSDDWSWFTNEVGEAAGAKGIVYGYGGATHDVVVVRRGQDEVARHPLTGQGYLLLAAGRDPSAVGHDLVDGVLAAASDYFGVPLQE